MKKIFSFVAVVAALLVAGNANAQLSVNAGFLNTTVQKHTETTIANKTNIKDTSAVLGGGFFVGASYNLPIIAGLGVAPGLYFDLTTKKEQTSGTGYTRTTTTTMTDLNVPIMINYRLALGDDLAIFAFVGPDVKIGLSAVSKYVLDSDLTGQKIEDYNMYETDEDEGNGSIKRFDVGLMFGAGAEFMGFRLQAGYELGMLNRAGRPEYSTTGASMKVRQNFNHFFVGVGYTF